MADRKTLLGQVISSLKQQRDELALQIHLGRAEARDQWNQLEAKLERLTEDFKPYREAVGETAENVVSGLELTAEEVKRGLDRVRKLLKDASQDGPSGE